MQSRNKNWVIKVTLESENVKKCNRCTYVSSIS